MIIVNEKCLDRFRQAVSVVHGRIKRREDVGSSSLLSPGLGRARRMPRHTNKTGPPCTFQGCSRFQYAKGFCYSHYERSRVGGKMVPLNSTVRPRGTPPRIRFSEQDCPNPELEGPCHVFSGSLNRKGYGQVFFDGVMVGVHRYVWQRDVGLIPPGMMIDHRCRVRSCCNVKHLRVVTAKANATENVVGAYFQILSARSHCPHGHPYDDENTYRKPKGGRSCRECGRNVSREYQRRKRARLRTVNDSHR